MKKTAWIAALVLLSAGVIAERAGSILGRVDDPVPEPVTCPLCGGDPQVHIRKTFAICETAGELAATALRW